MAGEGLNQGLVEYLRKGVNSNAKVTELAEHCQTEGLKINYSN